MSAIELMADLAALDIRLDAHGDRLRYLPRTALTPDLAERMKTYKSELLAILAAEAVDDPNAPQCGRCGSLDYQDTTIHNGQSTRRDCAKCRRFICFPRWHVLDR